MKTKSPKISLQDIFNLVKMGKIAIEVLNGKAATIPKQKIVSRLRYGMTRKVTIEEPIQVK